MTTPSESSEAPSPAAGGSTPSNQHAAPTASSGWGLGFASLAVVAFLAAFLVWSQSRSTARLPIEWEYLVQSDTELTDTGGLSERGQEKWELVAVEGGQQRRYYFKRPKSASNPATARVISPTGRWSGRIPAELVKQPRPPVKGPKSWAALWKALNQPGEAPAIDFSKNFVLHATTDGNEIDIIPVLYRTGNLRTTLRFGGRIARNAAEDGAFVIIALPREGIRTIDSVPITAAEPEG